MSDWQIIETAPKDGSVVRYRREVLGKTIFEGEACWRTIEVKSFINSPYGIEPRYTSTGWMYPDADKRVPEPTHWQPKTRQ